MRLAKELLTGIALGAVVPLLLTNVINAVLETSFIQNVITDYVQAKTISNDERFIRVSARAVILDIKFATLIALSYSFWLLLMRLCSFGPLIVAGLIIGAIFFGWPSQLRMIGWFSLALLAAASWYVLAKERHLNEERKR